MKKADLILLSDSIFTATGKPAFKGYVALKDGMILSVGEGDVDQTLIDDQTTCMELGNKTVTPAFSDVHCFFTGYSVGFVGVGLENAETVEDLVHEAKKYSLEIPEEKTVLGHGWNPELIKPEGTALLDEAFKDRPVILFAAGCETCFMNQAAIDKYQFTPDTCWPESYVRLLPDLLTDRDFIVPEFKRYMKMMNSRGITSVKEMGFDQFYGFTDILKDLEENKELTLRVSFMSQPVAEPTNLAYGKAMREKFQGEFVRFSGYNQMTDGSISQICGDLKEPYLCADTTCAQEINWQLLADDARAVDAEGFRFSLHAQGDAAISKVLDIYESCKRDENGRLINRHSITDLEFSDPEDLERMGRLGAIAEIYPQIQSIADREGKLSMISEKIGMERGKYYWNRRKMADSGVLLSCGTDLPLLIDDIPESIYHGVGGYFPEGGEPFNKQNMLTVEELLTAWSKGGAYNLFQENELGTLEPGKKADLVIFTENLFEVPLEDVRRVKVAKTFLNGAIVHEL
ncbi:MAG: amidohydrolase family protein [Dorea sp.]|nr:amidohydrolase family protein [Dorea sp.]